MPYSKPQGTPIPSTAERKKKLLADGALHRANILIARADIATGAQPGALTKEAISHFSATAKTLLFDTMRNTVAHPSKLSPLLMTGVSLLTKKSIRKPLIYAGVAGGAIAGAIYLVNLFSSKNDTNQNDGADH
jgi:hypothetical protein